MKFLVIFLTFIFLINCSEHKKFLEKEVEILIPFLAECKSTVEKAKIFLESNSKNKKHFFGVSTELFDQKAIFNSNIIGVVRLFSSGSWVGLNGMTSKEYLSLHATGIQADCFPDNSVLISEFDVPKLPSVISNLNGKYKSNVYLGYENNDIVVYFNDGSYSYNQL